MATESLATTTQVADIDLALCRATLYSALALGFRPPTEETIARLVSEEGTSALADAAIVLDGDHELELARHVKTLALAGATTVEDLFASYRRIFGHTASSVVPPYETEYGAEALFQQPQELGDLAGFYLAFGLTLNPAEHERSDHVSCECEFLSFLALKEAYALESNDVPMLEEVRKAARLFLRDHLGRFVPAFCRKLKMTAKQIFPSPTFTPQPHLLPSGEKEGMRGGENRGGFYGALGDLCLLFVIQECARLGVPMGPEHLSLRPATDNSVPMACGSGAECAAMPGAFDPEESGAV